MFNTEILLIILTVVFLIVALYKEWFRAPITFLIAITFLLITGIITTEDALKGFSNDQLWVIILLLAVGGVFQRTSVLNTLLKGVFSKKDSEKGFLIKMVSSVGISSSILNNTPIVALLMPYVYKWARDHDLPASKFLIPLSYASILGGCCTVIGTSTLMIASSISVSMGHGPIDMFAPTMVGVSMLVIGFIYLVFFGPKLLPDHGDAVNKTIAQSRKFFLETYVKKDSPIIGKNIEDAGLRSLKGVFLVEILRGDERIRPVSPKEVLRHNDILFFGGVSDWLEELTGPDMGLALPRACDIPVGEKSEIVEVVISHRSKLNGKRVKDTDFRGKFDGAIVAIHRNGEKLWGKIGDIELRSGDVLLVLAGRDFLKRVSGNPSFYLISKVKDVREIGTGKALFLVSGLALAIALATMGLVPLLISLLVLLTASIVLKMVTPSEIRKYIDFNMAMIIALGLALGKAIANTGLDRIIADGVISASGVLGPAGLLAGLFIVTNLLTSFITSKAAVALILPIALSMGTALGQESLPYVLAVAFGGAANFVTPIGYQTNLMVYGPGGYSFRDFFKIGLPLTLLYMVVSTVILLYTYNL